MNSMNRWMLIGAISALGGLLVIGTLSSAFGGLGGGGFASASLAYHPPQGDDPILEDSAGVWFQLGAAIREVERIEPAYRTAQAEVKEAARQIKSFLPVTLEASEPIKQNPTDLVAVLGMKKIPMKENVSSLRFEARTFMGEMPQSEPVLLSKSFFRILRE